MIVAGEVEQTQKLEMAIQVAIELGTEIRCFICRRLPLLWVVHRSFQVYTHARCLAIGPAKRNRESRLGRESLILRSPVCDIRIRQGWQCQRHVKEKHRNAA